MTIRERFRPSDYVSGFELAFFIALTVRTIYAVLSVIPYISISSDLGMKCYPLFLLVICGIILSGFGLKKFGLLIIGISLAIEWNLYILSWDSSQILLLFYSVLFFVLSFSDVRNQKQLKVERLLIINFVGIYFISGIQKLKSPDFIQALILKREVMLVFDKFISTPNEGMYNLKLVSWFVVILQILGPVCWFKFPGFRKPLIFGGVIFHGLSFYFLNVELLSLTMSVFLIFGLYLPLRSNSLPKL